MDTKETGLEDFAPRHVPYRCHWRGNSLRSFGFLLILFGASTVISTIGSSSANNECALLGVILLLIGFLLLILSEFHDSDATDGFARNEPNLCWLDESLHRYGLLLMLVGASIVMLTIGQSSAAYSTELVLVGIILLLFGLCFVLLVFSELRSLGASDLDEFFG